MFKFVMLLLISLLSKPADMNTTQLEADCSAYCFTTLKPLLQISADCVHKDLQLTLIEQELKTVRENKEQVEEKCNKQLQIEVAHKEKFAARKQKKDAASLLRNLDSRDQLKNCQTNLNLNTATIAKQPQLIAELQSNARVLQEELDAVKGALSDCRSSPNQQKITATNCLQFKNAATLHIIKLPKYPAFQVACENGVAGPGWLVIQRRINGAVDFYRNWQEYRIGFGDLRREFFIGLENLHQLTHSEPQELFVYMEDFRNTSKFARYDSFKIGSEQSGYKLQLGEYTGSADDAMRIDDGLRFTTYDRDNDRMLGKNCARYTHGGWWYKSCSWSNLNGGYFNTKPVEFIWWSTSSSPTTSSRLKTVQMLIRPTKFYGNKK